MYLFVILLKNNFETQTQCKVVTTRAALCHGLYIIHQFITEFLGVEGLVWRQQDLFSVVCRWSVDFVESGHSGC